MQDDRTLSVAIDAAVIFLIEGAIRRLVVKATALSHATAEALAARFDNLEHLDVRLIIDADAEVHAREVAKQAQAR
jgi:hypothetical protein